MSTLADIETIRTQVCRALCADVEVRARDDGSLMLSTPFHFPDGDGFRMFLSRLPAGGYRLSDKGSTLMHLSYEQDIDMLREGTRGRVFEQILSEMGVHDDQGEIQLDSAADKLGDGIFRFGQALTRIHDLSFLNRVQVESTFYDDLQQSLVDIVGSERLVKDYVATGVPQSEVYKADFGVNAPRPLLIFGVPNVTKARLATVVIQYLQQQRFGFHSLVVYSDMATIPRPDVARLTNAANDQVASIDFAAMRRKIEDALAA